VLRATSQSLENFSSLLSKQVGCRRGPRPLGHQSRARLDGLLDHVKEEDEEEVKVVERRFM